MAHRAVISDILSGLFAWSLNHSRGTEVEIAAEFEPAAAHEAFPRPPDLGIGSKSAHPQSSAAGARPFRCEQPSDRVRPGHERRVQRALPVNAKFGYLSPGLPTKYPMHYVPEVLMAVLTGLGIAAMM